VATTACISGDVLTIGSSDISGLVLHGAASFLPSFKAATVYIVVELSYSANSATSPVCAHGNLGYKHIMNVFHYIDDNKMLLEIFEALITSMDKKVKTFSSPMIYLEYMNSADYVEPAAVFTDIQMPGMDGYQLIEKIREQYPAQRFVAISAYEESLENSHEAACMHIRKPFHGATLRFAVDVLLRCKRHCPETANEACTELFEKYDCVIGARNCPHKTSFL